MATAKPPGRGCGALPRWLLGAALLLGLRLCMELRHVGSRPPGRRDPPGPPRTHVLPAPGPPRGARRRQVTYVRSGRRALPRGGRSTTPPEPSCCAQRGLPRRKGPRWRIELQPWAGPSRSLDEEASRFLSYISTTQVVFQAHISLGIMSKIACDHMGTDSLATDSSPAQKPWFVCLDDRFGLAHQIRSKRCRLYSLGLGSDDTHFEVSMANGGCEVHRFDPSIRSAHVLESQRLWHHRLSIDWRDPHPAVAAQKPHSHTRKLGSILNEFGHHKIDVLKADLESAEWKVLENLILEDVLDQIGQLVFEIHLHWPGFEVRGSESSVVRFWYSLLKELERKHFRLFHTYKDLSKPQLFLEKDLFNASSCYTLSWVNTRWR
ncbi:LOW QUALITY PROTEIN: probable methyltransferase-like protein 24 [Apodemus sylvaticus]|uniref:LOW QUALITY PROTEIN: probable methyltransferase-like protein 24 n=1 Tax=Apodemus sylvaticus TaxID=10129 RepID=UPI00224481E2|nr:LOW QUALITY PROTEIN: probable methyltransferase-like protein 24 [Apodemus sylvaticus]